MSAENPRCPECQTELEDDFGIVDCRSCGAVCSVDLDGEVQIQGEVPESVEEPEEEQSFELADEAAVDEEEPAYEEQPVYEEPLEEEETAEQGEELLGEEEYSLEEPEESVEFAEESNEEDVELESLEPVEEEESEEFLAEEASAVEAIAPMMGVDFLKDLETFTEESSAEELEHIYYDLSILGVESAESRELVIETLSDQRLEISEEYLRELIGEESDFVVPQLSFLRLSVAYKRLLTLGLEMSWSLSEGQAPVQVVEEAYEGEEAGEYDDSEYLEDDLS
ncbi:MAG: hypothetical protein ACRBBP_07055 [Bdellovibrionales bacterium]